MAADKWAGQTNYFYNATSKLEHTLHTSQIDREGGGL